MSKFLLGGRLGDVFHMLWVVAQHEGKHDLFITDRRDLHSDGFVKSLPETIDELLPILEQQTWFNSLSILPTVYSKSDDEFRLFITDPINIYDPVLNLNLWRRFAYSASWTQLLASTFNLQPKGGAWVVLPKIAGWQDEIVIHCSVHAARRGDHWNIINDNYSGTFVGNEEEYKAFGYPIPFHEPKSLLEHLLIINSCKFFIGNQSMPLAAAHAMGTPRLAMLNEVDKLHYIGEEKWHDNYYWMAKYDHNYEGLKYL